MKMQFLASTESFDAEVSDADFGVKSTNIEKATGKVTIADADIGSFSRKRIERS